MKPIKTKHTNAILGAPKEWNQLRHGPCIGLPVCQTEDPYIYSWWRASWCERLAILLGKPIKLCIVGSVQPPVAVDVEPAGPLWIKKTKEGS